MKISPMSVEYIGHYGTDDTVVNAARVSFAKDASGYSAEANNRLIKYLAKHKHHSPFNHAFLSFRVKAPMFVAAQLHKHKFMPVNSVSRRYVDEEPEFYFPDYWRAKAENVKQGSSDDPVNLSHIFGWGDKKLDPHTITAKSLETYDELITSGICPEQARMVLPQNTMTEWYWSGTLGAFLDMLVLRLDNHTQKETRDVAQLVANEVKLLFPASYEAYLGER